MLNSTSPELKDIEASILLSDLNVRCDDFCEIVDEFSVQLSSCIIVCYLGLLDNIKGAIASVVFNSYKYTEVARFQLNEALYLVMAVSMEDTASVEEASQLFDEPKQSPMDLLTERELQIVQLVARGHSNKMVARRLGISQWTVSTHLKRIFLKLQVDSRAAMVYKCASALNNPTL